MQPPTGGAVAEVVPSFGPWADELWEAHRGDYLCLAVRDRAMMNALIMLDTTKLEGKAYMKKHCIRGLMLELTESVMLHRPEHPEQFLQEVLARQAQQQLDEAAGAAAQAGPGSFDLDGVQGFAVAAMSPKCTTAPGGGLFRKCVLRSSPRSIADAILNKSAPGATITISSPHLEVSQFDRTDRIRA